MDESFLPLWSGIRRSLASLIFRDDQTKMDMGHLSTWPKPPMFIKAQLLKHPSKAQSCLKAYNPDPFGPPAVTNCIKAGPNKFFRPNASSFHGILTHNIGLSAESSSLIPNRFPHYANHYLTHSKSRLRVEYPFVIDNHEICSQWKGSYPGDKICRHLCHKCQPRHRPLEPTSCVPLPSVSFLIDAPKAYLN